MSNKKLDLTIKGEGLKKSLGQVTEFFKRSSKNFNPLSKSEYYGTLIQIMRSDILELESLIKKNSDVLLLYKMNSKK